MQALLALMRFPNLVIVVLTQCLLYYRVLVPALQTNDIEQAFSNYQFGIFVMITVLITAGGNIINDLLDYPTDVFNKPEKIIIEKKIASSTAYWLYFSFNLLGYVLALYLAFTVQFLPYFFLFPAAVAGLYLYSHHLKKRPLWGNLIVASYCAAVAAIILLAEKESLQILYEQNQPTAIRVGALFIWYIVFAFFATLYRELIKDLQDEPGDRATGLHTAPIAWGQGPTKIVSFIIGLCLLLYIVIWFGLFYNQFSIVAWIFLGFGVTLPLLYTLLLLIKAKTAHHFHHLSQVTKWLMLAGILLLLLF